MSARLPSREPVRPSSPQRTENRKGSRIGAQRWLGARPSRDDSDSSSSSFSEKDEVPEMDDSEGHTSMEEYQWGNEIGADTVKQDRLQGRSEEEQEAPRRNNEELKLWAKSAGDTLFCAETLRRGSAPVASTKRVRKGGMLKRREMTDPALGQKITRREMTDPTLYSSGDCELGSNDSGKPMGFMSFIHGDGSSPHQNRSRAISTLPAPRQVRVCRKTQLTTSEGGLVSAVSVSPRPPDRSPKPLGFMAFTSKEDLHRPRARMSASSNRVAVSTSSHVVKKAMKASFRKSLSASADGLQRTGGERLSETFEISEDDELTLWHDIQMEDRDSSGISVSVMVRGAMNTFEPAIWLPQHTGFRRIFRKWVALSFRWWIDVDELLNEIDRIGGANPSYIQKRSIGRFLRAIVIYCPSDFLKHLIRSRMYDLVMKYAREEDLKVIKEYLAERESVESRQNIMAPRTPRARSATDIVNVDPNVAAQQMCLIDQEIFNAIESREFYRGEWQSKKKKKLAPNLCRAAERFDLTYRWVVAQVVSADDMKRQIALVRFFIHLASALHDLANFQSMMAILTGLHSHYLLKMKDVWKRLPSSAWDKFEALQELVDPADNFRVYRFALEQAIPPAIPYLPVHLRDIMFADDGNETWLDEAKTRVNPQKLRIVGKLMALLIKWRAIQYVFLKDVDLYDELTNLSATNLTDGDLANMKQMFETRDLSLRDIWNAVSVESPDPSLRTLRRPTTEAADLEPQARRVSDRSTRPKKAKKSAASHRVYGSGHGPSWVAAERLKTMRALGSCIGQGAAARAQDTLAIYRRMVHPSNGVPVRERTFKMRFHQCFTGADAIAWLIEDLDLTSKEQAIAIGCNMMQDRYFHHVAYEEPLADSKKSFYAFQPLGNVPSGTPAFPFEGKSVEESISVLLVRMTAPDGGLLMKQRRYRMSKVRCFTGQECVDWMCDRLRMLRPQALVLGDMLINKGYIKHVSQASPLVDEEMFFYQFTRRSVVEVARVMGVKAKDFGK